MKMNRVPLAERSSNEYHHGYSDGNANSGGNGNGNENEKRDLGEGKKEGGGRYVFAARGGAPPRESGEGGTHAYSGNASAPAARNQWAKHARCVANGSNLTSSHTGMRSEPHHPFPSLMQTQDITQKKEGRG